MRQTAPYRKGSTIAVLHTCKHHNLAIAELPVRASRRMSDDHSWRITAARCDGSPLEVVVGSDGCDSDGYACPSGAIPAAGGGRPVREPLTNYQPDLLELLP